jgi:hypothetical protein
MVSSNWGTKILTPRKMKATMKEEFDKRKEVAALGKRYHTTSLILAIPADLTSGVGILLRARMPNSTRYRNTGRIL